MHFPRKSSGLTETQPAPRGDAGRCTCSVLNGHVLSKNGRCGVCGGVQPLQSDNRDAMVMKRYPTG